MFHCSVLFLFCYYVCVVFSIYSVWCMSSVLKTSQLLLLQMFLLILSFFSSGIRYTYFTLFKLSQSPLILHLIFSHSFFLFVFHFGLVVNCEEGEHSLIF